MRRGLLLVGLALAGCGGSHHSGGGETSTAVLRMTRLAGASLGGLDADDRPQIAYRTGFEAALRVLTLAGERKYPVPTTALVNPTALANDFVLTVIEAGNLVFDLRTGASRTVAGVTPLATEGNRVLWETTDGTKGLSIEDLNTGIRTPAPIALSQQDDVLSYRNGRLLIRRGVLTPIEGGERINDTYEVVTLDGTLVSTLQMPNGISNVRPVALSATGQVAGTATRPGAILTIDSRPYVVRWDASGVPTFLDTTTPSAVAGIEDDGSVVAGPDGDQAGPLRLLRGGAPIDLGIALPPLGRAQVQGRFMFVQSYDYRISAYALP